MRIDKKQLAYKDSKNTYRYIVLLIIAADYIRLYIHVLRMNYSNANLPLSNCTLRLSPNAAEDRLHAIVHCT
jgi:hypothetical protein